MAEENVVLGDEIAEEDEEEAEANTTYYEVKFFNGTSSFFAGAYDMPSVEAGTAIPSPKEIGEKIGGEGTDKDKILVGWYKEAELTTPVAFPYTVNENTTLYAKLVAADAKHFVSYQTTAGVEIHKATEVAIGATVMTVSALQAEVEGYTIASTAKYYLDKAMSADKVVEPGTGKTYDNTVLYVPTTTKQCTVTFNSNGGSAVGGFNVAYGGTIAKPADPTKAGKTFVGWYDYGNGSNFELDSTTNEYKIKASTTPTLWKFAGEAGAMTVMTNKTLIGIWSTEQIKVTFDDGTLPLKEKPIDYNTAPGYNSGDGTTTMATGRAWALAAAAKDGYKCMYWYSGTDDSTEYDWTAKITAPVTLKAKYAKLVTVTLINGSTSTPVAASYAEGETIPATDATVAAQAAPEGKVISGWYDKDTGAKFVFGTTKLTGDTTLEAKIVDKKWKVTFNGASVPAQTVTHGGNVTRPSDPAAPAGQMFGGWYADSGFATPWKFAGEVSATAVSADTVIYAKFVAAVNVTVKNFKTDAVIATQKFASGSAVKFSELTKPTLENSKFKLWHATNGTSDAGVASTAEASTYLNGSTTAFNLIADATVYAEFEAANTITVIFDVDGEKTYQYVTNGYAVKPADPSKTGFSFAGWFVGGSNTAVTWSSDKYAVTGATTFTARWNPNKLTVDFDLNNGAWPKPDPNLVPQPLPMADSVEVEYGTAVAKPDKDPVRAGWTFTGWNKGTTAYDFAAPVTEDTTLTAGWTASTYTVVFVNEGSTVKSTTVTSGNTIADFPADPTKAGSTFVGWFDETTNKQYTKSTVFSAGKNTTLTAHYNTAMLTVAFNKTYAPGAGTENANHPDNPDSQSVAYGGKITDNKDWYTTDYFYAHDTLEGWYTDEGLTKKFNPASDTVTENLTLYGKYVASTYKVTFIVDNQSVAEVSVQYGKKIPAASKPADPVKTGKKFNGWYDAPTGDGAVTVTTANVTADTKWYARFTAQTYKVTFKTTALAPTGATLTTAIEGSAWDDSNKVLTVPYGAKLTEKLVKPASEPDGQMFTGWFTDAQCSAGKEYTYGTAITADVDLWGKTVTAYTVTFYKDTTNAYNATTTNFGPKKVAQTVASLADPGNAPNESGKVFTGWWDAATGGARVTFPLALSGDKNLYARFEDSTTCTVTFAFPGGVTGAATTTDAIPQYVAKGGYAKELNPAPALDGWTFGGYYEDADYITPFNFTGTKINENKTVYVKMTKETFTVSFAGDGVTGSAYADQTIDYGARATQPANPTKAGHTFDYWVAEGETTAFSFSTVIKKNTKLTAQYHVNTYSVTFNGANGATIATATAEYNTVLAAKDIPANPTKTGETFIGWFEGNATTATDLTKPITKTMVLDPKFKKTTKVVATITGWAFGDKPNTPTAVVTPTAAGSASFQWAPKGTETWTAWTSDATAPTAVGEYTLKATVAETKDYAEGVGTATFSITQAALDPAKDLQTVVDVDPVTGNVTVTVKDKDGKVISTETVKAGESKAGDLIKVTTVDDGKGTVTVTVEPGSKANFKFSPYTATQTYPLAPTISALTAQKKCKLKVAWSAMQNVEGFEIQYNLKKKEAGAKKVTVKSGTAVSTTLKKLTVKKRYYVRIRSFTTVNGKKVVSKWSAWKRASKKNKIFKKK